MRQAIVVIHGIGEQRPLATIRQFVKAITDQPARSKPDRMSESFELRRFSLVPTKSLPITDIYELYWAHHMGSARWGFVLGWMRRLLLRRTGALPIGLRAMHRALWVLFLLALTGPLYSLVSVLRSGEGLSSWFMSIFTYTPALAVVVQWITGRVVLSYVGDAARYLTPDPENIEARGKIRAEGVKLLRQLHEARRYSRIVVVGHSLGSVIGYDVLRHLWDELRIPSFKETKPQPEAAAFEQTIRLLSDPAEGTSRAAAVASFQQAQHRLWREQRALGIPWLVTDFITLGSPLAHAALLLEDPQLTLEQRKLERELPTCPPTSGEDETHYLERHEIATPDGQQPWSFRIPHHSAPFASTRWTNLYFPHRRLVLGDIVGGPLADVFGSGIRDVPVRPARSEVLTRTLASHVHYWSARIGKKTDTPEMRRKIDKLTGTKDSIIALRSALWLQAKRSKEPWPEP